jgi:2,4-dichlorophenol 6-monooxygenase
MKLIETDVLVVGAGPAGLTASALLARAGVKAIGITKCGGTADSPRAHITNQRTVEVLRDLGVEGRLREAAMPQNIMGIQIFATSFAGMELSRTMAWGAGIDRRTDYERASPSAMCNISQHKLEPIILEAALRPAIPSEDRWMRVIAHAFKLVFDCDLGIPNATTSLQATATRR